MDPKPRSSKRIRRDSIEREASERFKRVVGALDRGCVMEGEGECSGVLHAHHVIYQQHLRDRGRSDLLWDTRNSAILCERHHMRHHRRLQVVPRTRLPARCLKFVHDHCLADLLGRYYS